MEKKHYMTIKKVKNLFKNRISFWLNRKKGIVSGMPVSLSVEPAAICQLHCPECILGTDQLQRANKFLDFELYKKLIDEAAPTLTCLILYFQGEPFLAPQIFEMIRYADQRHIFTQTSTNAQAIDKACAENIVRSGLKKLIISFDGTTQESYSLYRKGGDLQKAIQAIEYINYAKEKLHQKTPRIELQMLVFSHNENEIKDFKLLAKTMHVQQATLKTAQIYNINAEGKAQLLPLQSRYSRYRYKDGRWMLKKPLKNRCLRMWQGAVLTTDGDLLPCCYDKNSQFSYGNLNEMPLHKLWNSESAIHFRKSVTKNRKAIDICQNCTE